MAFLKSERFHTMRLKKPLCLKPVQPVDPLFVKEHEGETSVKIERAPVKYASMKRRRRAMVNAQRELLKDNKANKYVPDDVDTPTRNGHRMKTNKQPPVEYVTMIGQTYLPDRPRSPDLAPVDWEAHDEIVAQRLIRFNKAAPQRKRRTK